MPTRTLILATALAATLGLSVPAFARPHVVAQKTASGTVYMRTSLIPGHRYQIQITSRGHIKFGGSADEFYTYSTSKAFGTGNKNLTLNGSTPRTFTFGQPARLTLTSWLLAAQMIAPHQAKLTMKFLDLGKHT